MEENLIYVFCSEEMTKLCKPKVKSLPLERLGSKCHVALYDEDKLENVPDEQYQKNRNARWRSSNGVVDGVKIYKEYEEMKKALEQEMIEEQGCDPEDAYCSWDTDDISALKTYMKERKDGAFIYICDRFGASNEKNTTAFIMEYAKILGRDPIDFANEYLYR